MVSVCVSFWRLEEMVSRYLDMARGKGWGGGRGFTEYGNWECGIGGNLKGSLVDLVIHIFVCFWLFSFFFFFLLSLEDKGKSSFAEVIQNVRWSLWSIIKTLKGKS